MKKSFLFILTLAIVSIGVSYAADCDVAAPSCAPSPTCGCAKCGNVFSGLFDCKNNCSPCAQPACSNCGAPANACCCNKIGCNPCAKPCLAPLFQPRCTYEKPACKSDWYPGKNLGILNCLFGSLCSDPCAPKCGCGAPTCNSCNPCAPKCAPATCAPAAPACGCGAPACNSCKPCNDCTVGNRCGRLSCGFCGAKAACAPAACAPAAAPTPAEPGAAAEAAPAAPAAACDPVSCAPATCAPATCAPATCAPATCVPSCNPCAPVARCEVNCGLVEDWYPGKAVVNFLRVLTVGCSPNNACGCGAPTCNSCAPKCAPVATCEPRKACCEFRPFGGLFADLFACNSCDPCAPKCGCGAPTCNSCAPKCAPATCAPAPSCNPCAPKCAPATPCAAAAPACAPAATVACQPAGVAPTPAEKTILPEPTDSANSKSILSPSEMSTASLGTITE